MAQIATKTSGGSTGVYLSGVIDHVLWFTKNAEHTKYRALFGTKELGEEGADKYSRVRLPSLPETRSLTPAERSKPTCRVAHGYIAKTTSRAKASAAIRARAPHHGFQ